MKHNLRILALFSVLVWLTMLQRRMISPAFKLTKLRFNHESVNKFRRQISYRWRLSRCTLTFQDLVGAHACPFKTLPNLNLVSTILTRMVKKMSSLALIYENCQLYVSAIRGKDGDFHRSHRFMLDKIRFALGPLTS